VTDVGLNGVMITPGETTQRFSLRAESWVKAQTLPVFVVGKIETTSPQRYEFPAQAFTLAIRPATGSSAPANPAGKAKE
jgi:hypothetical protein